MKIRLVIKEDVGRIEERTLQVNYLIPFKSCYKGFPVIKYTYVPCLKVTMLCVFAFCYLIVLKFFWAITYSEPCQTSKMELFAKIVISKEYQRLLNTPLQFLIYIAVYLRFEITCIFCHFSTIRFPFETLSILGFLRP